MPTLGRSWRFRLTIAGLTSARPARPTGRHFGIDTTCARDGFLALPVKTGAGSDLLSRPAAGRCFFLSVVTCATSGWASFDRVFGFIAAPRATPPGSLGFRVLLLLRHAPRRRRLSPLRAWPLFIHQVVADPVGWFGVLKIGCFASRCLALRVADVRRLPIGKQCVNTRR